MAEKNKKERNAESLLCAVAGTASLLIGISIAVGGYDYISNNYASINSPLARTRDIICWAFPAVFFAGTGLHLLYNSLRR